MATNKQPVRKSEMWERFRAARSYAKKTQAHIAAAVGGITRGAVAQWEADTPSLRTKPSAEQVMAFAQACGVPVAWLLDDSQSTVGLYSYMQTHLNRVREPAAPTGKTGEVHGKAFWSAVQYGAISINPELADRFDVPVKIDGTSLRAPFLDGKHLASFASDSSDWHAVVVREVGALLVIEKALGHACDKALFMWSPSEGVTTKEMQIFAQRLDTSIVVCHDVREASKMLAKL